MEESLCCKNWGDKLNAVHFKFKPLVLAISLGLATVNCANAADQGRQETCQGNWKSILTVGGGILGGFLGNKLGDGNGKVVATVAGVALGGMLGNYIGGEIDRRHCELEKIANANGIKINNEQIELKSNVLQAGQANSSFPASSNTTTAPANATGTSGQVDVSTWNGQEHFQSGSAELTPKAAEYFKAAAVQYDARTAVEAYLANEDQSLTQQGKPPLSKQERASKYNELIKAHNMRPIVLVGYTDDVGDSLSNQQLSERRAKAVALIFNKQGVPVSRIYFRGAGETEPIADNRTEEGRAANRRVEILELESKEKLENYISLKESNTKFYRARNQVAATPQEHQGNAKEQASQKTLNGIVPEVADGSNSSDTESHSSSSAQPQTIVASGIQDKTVVTGESNAVTTDNSTALQSSGSAVHHALSGEIDFGGKPFNGNMNSGIVKAVGNPVTPQHGIADSIASLSSFFVREAKAEDDHVYSSPCTVDSPRYGGEYLSLETGGAVKKKTSEYAPGLYQTTWVGVVNGNYIGITPLAVLRDSYKPDSIPSMLVYANTEKPSKDSKAAMKLPMAVNVYPGDKGILYRMFAKTKSEVVCTDVVLPRQAPFDALAGELYYKKDGSTYESSFVPSMLKL